MILGGVFADEQAIGDLAVAQAQADQLEHLELASGDAVLLLDGGVIDLVTLDDRLYQHHDVARTAVVAAAGIADGEGAQRVGGAVDGVEEAGAAARFVAPGRDDLEAEAADLFGDSRRAGLAISHRLAADDRDDAADRLVHEQHGAGLVEDDHPGQAPHVDDVRQFLHDPPNPARSTTVNLPGRPLSSLWNRTVFYYR